MSVVPAGIGAADERTDVTSTPDGVLAPKGPSGRRATRGRQKPVGGRTASVLLWVYAAFALIPLLLMLSSSFRSNGDLISDPLGAPWPLSFDAYREAWTAGNFATYFGNSLLVTLGAVLLSTTVSTMAAYALARGRSRIFRWLESLFLSGLMLPIHLAILPIFYLFDGAGLIDSRLGLALMYGASGVPFSIFVLTTFFRQLPAELEEAATLDGATAWQTFWRIMVPLVRPAVATVAVFRFVPSGTTSSSRSCSCARRTSTRCRSASRRSSARTRRTTRPCSPGSSSRPSRSSCSSSSPPSRSSPG